LIRQIDYTSTLLGDSDEFNIVQRYEVYDKKVEMLLKLANSSEGPTVLKEGLQCKMSAGETDVKFTYDLRRNPNLESLPNQVTLVLMNALVAQK